jgi:hypothetical protein
LSYVLSKIINEGDVKEKWFFSLEFSQFFLIVTHPPLNSIFYNFIILVLFFSFMFNGGYVTIVKKLRKFQWRESSFLVKVTNRCSSTSAKTKREITWNHEKLYRNQ